MKYLSELFDNQFFLMDIGITQTAKLNDETVEVGRYAAFSPNKDQKGHQVVEISNNIEYLCQKYHISTENLCVLEEEGAV